MIRRGRSSVGDQLRERLRAGELRRPDDRAGTRRSTPSRGSRPRPGSRASSMFEREVAAHGAEADDAERAAAHAISPAPPTSACFERDDRACARRSSSPMSDASVPSPSDTTRDVAASAPVSRRLEARARLLARPQRQIDRAAVSVTRASGDRPVRLVAANLDRDRRSSSAARACIHAAKSARRGRVATPRSPGCGTTPRRRRTSRQVEEMRHRRAPARQPRPAQVASAPCARRARRARAQPGSGGSSASSTTRSASVARSSSASTEPPRHQTTVGRLDSRSAATALFR